MHNNANVAEKTMHSWRNGAVIKKPARDLNNMMLSGMSDNAHHVNVTDNMKTKPMHTFNADDTLRISKIIRHLLDETNANAALELCKKLDVAVKSPTNIQYVCRSFQQLSENMLSFIKLGPSECAEYASRILGMMCYINRTDFYRWQRVLFEEFERCNSSKLKKYIMLTLKTILSYDANNLELAPHSVELLAKLKDCLENAAIAKDFMVVSEAIVDFAKYYTHEFKEHFTDIVDIIVGWHLEVEQLPALKMHCSIVLQKLAPYFIKEQRFTRGLLEQFLEDIAVCQENVNDKMISNEEREQAEMRFGAFVGAFNTISKAIAQLYEFVEYRNDIILIQAWLIITTTATQTLGLKLSSEETIINLNEFLYIIYRYYWPKYEPTLHHIQTTETIIKLQLDKCNLFSSQQKLSLFNLILCIVRKLGNTLPISMANCIFARSKNLKLMHNKRLYKLLLRIYRTVLLLKDVQLVQKAYLYLEENKEMLLSPNKYNQRSRYATLFNVAALSVLATQTSSMISMHALEPSIFQYLLFGLELGDDTFNSMHPTMHSAMLRVFMLHCQKHRQFLASSFTINERFGFTQSGTYYTSILTFLRNALYSNQFPNMDIIFDWIYTLLKQCKESASVLWHENTFIDFCALLCKSKNDFETKLLLKHAACIQLLLDYVPPPPHNLMQLIYQSVHTILMRYHGQQHEEVKRVYTEILARLPLVITLTSSLASEQLSQIRDVQQLHEWYKAAGHNSPLRSKYFKPLLDSVDVTPTFNNVRRVTQATLEQRFSGYFNRCWTLNATAPVKATEYLNLVQSSDQLLYAWLQHEAARYCVHNKLRTVLGKPQETFLTIEAIIMRYARLITFKSITTPSSSSSSSASAMMSTIDKNCSYNEWLGSQRLLARTRQLLGFLEELEKCIYNAAEGCAFAILPAEKAAKTFFRINSHTCHEWFKRINAGVCLIALHSMQPEMAIRYCENLFRTENLQGVQLENTAVTLTWALLNCGDSDALHGLYAYTGRRYIWIQYAAEQASGRREAAADGYATILNDADNNGNNANANIKLETYLREFLIEQLYECLYSTAQWKKLRIMQQSWPLQPRRPEHLDAMDKLCFDHDVTEENLSKLLTLTEWDAAQRVPNNSSMHMLRQLEDVCMAHVIKRGSINENLTEQLCTTVQGALLENLSHGTFNGRQSNVQTNYIILNHMMMHLQSPDAAIQLDTDETYIPTAESGALLKSLLWSRLLAERFHNTAHIPITMYLNIAAAARREGNPQLCRTMLQRFFAHQGFDNTLTNIAEQLQSNSYKLNIKNSQLLRGFGELTECYNVTQHQIEAIELGAAYCRQIVQQLQVEVDVESASYMNAASTASHMLLRLADWLQSQRNSNSSISCNTPQLQYLLSCLPIDDNANINDATDIPIVERAVSRLINSSIAQRSDIAEAWYAYGNLCYRWGKRSAEARANANVGGISMQERNAIHDLLHGDAQLLLLDKIESMLNDQMFNTHDDPSITKEEEEEEGRTEEDDVEDESPETIDDYNTSERLKSDLQKLNALDTEQIAAIVRIWRQVHSNAYYETATRAYFRYLAIAADEKTTKNSMDCIFVTTTLRILRLIVKHALGLQETLEESLDNTPMRPWKSIIPQLFSRLNHHEPYVRKIVADLLCKLSGNYSNLVLYPAIVGAMQERQPQTYSALVNACKSKVYPGRVVELQGFITHLKRITLLWDEHWLHSLAQVYADYAPLFNTLELQTKQITNVSASTSASANTTASQDITRLKTHYSIIIEHLLADLKRIAVVTKREPQSPYERNFQERYNSFINSTINALEDDYKNAINCDNTGSDSDISGSGSKPSESWLRLKQLYSVFQQRALRTNAVTLKLSDIGPKLIELSKIGISMPCEQFKFINSVDNNVHILPTKTRPKKLTFIDNTGGRFTYLFKGLEDLHLDERIMQFLNIANSMMARQSEQTTITSAANLRAQHYAVIPLGRQSGIIRWVDGMTPLFSIYKKWQQRDIALKQQQKERQHTTTTQAIQQQQQQSATVATVATSTTATATRPSELFYGKLAPLLAEHNLKINDPRKQWPLPVLHRVLTELTNETPRDLLAKELWCCAMNAAEWRQVVRNYATSTAVMSVIGYVIGLGDRHLDNILIKLSSGEVLHIDYNVCFEKGKTLRVPEKVPFRMTPNIEEALGLTGIEGTFRLTCEHVLRILRKERETLLTLLEAFVYDPLIDWTLNDEGAAASARITTAHVAAMRIECHQNGDSNTTIDSMAKVSPRVNWLSKNISARFNKFKPSWLKYNDELESELLKIVTNLNSAISTLELTRHEELEQDSLNKELAMIEELKTLGTAMGSHALNTASMRYAAYKRDAEIFHAIKSNVQSQHKQTLEQISLINDGIGELTTLNEYLLSLESDTNIRNELRQQMEIIDIDGPCNELRYCFNLLLKHGHIRQYEPRARQQQRNPLVQCERWYRELLDNELDAANLELKIRDWHRDFSKENDTALAYANRLETVTIALRTQETELINNLNELEEMPTLNFATNELHNFLSNEGTSYVINQLKCLMLQTIKEQNDKFISDDLKQATLDNHLLDIQLEHIEFILTMCHTEPLCSDIDISELLSAITLLNTTLKSLNELKCAFELPLLKRIVQLFMRNDHDELQLLMKHMCNPTLRSQELFNTESSSASLHTGVIGDFYALLQDISNVFAVVESNLEQLFAVAGALFSQQQEQLPLNLMQLQIKIFDKHILYTIKKLKYDIIAQIFDLVYCSVNAMNNHNTQHIYDIKNMNMPILKYVCHVENVYLAGLTSLFAYVLQTQLELSLPLYEAEIAVAHSQGHISITILKLVWEMFAEAIRHEIVLKKTQQQHETYVDWQQHQNDIFIAFCWTNDIDCTSFGFGEEFTLTAIQNTKQSLDKLQGIFVHYQATLEQLGQRQTFELLRLELSHSIFYVQLCTRLNEHTEALLRYKQLHEVEIVALADKWQLSYTNWRRSAALITPVEQALVQLLDPEGNIDDCWIKNITGLLNEMIYTTQRKLTALEKEVSQLLKQLRASRKPLQQFSDAQERALLGHLFKLMHKLNRRIYSGVSTLHQKDKDCHSQLGRMQYQLRYLVPESSFLMLVRTDAENLRELVMQNRQELLEFMQQLTSDESQQSSSNAANLKSNNNSQLNLPLHTDRKISCNQNEQKRNAYAVSVWKRIRMKLEGRDFSAPNSRTSVPEQVDFIIREAMNTDNLAVLYEGWTPWV